MILLLSTCEVEIIFLIFISPMSKRKLSEVAEGPTAMRVRWAGISLVALTPKAQDFPSTPLPIKMWSMMGTSLMVQWLRLPLQMQEVWIWSAKSPYAWWSKKPKT